MRERSEESCDIRIWSGNCERSGYSGIGEKFLCTSCESLDYLDHEVHHEIFPHVTGDEKNLY